MILKKLYTSSFRNLEQADLSFGDRFNIFYGNNAQGKTNLLESIYLLGTMKSFRLARNTELIRWGAHHGLLKGWVEKDGVTREISLLLERECKKARVDRKSVIKLSDFFGSLNVVVFSPEEMTMVKGAPDIRRRYLDRAIFSGDADYLRLHHDYYRILKNRNILLKNGDTGSLDVWSEKLAEAGARLAAKRVAYVGEIEPLVRESYAAIAGGGEEASIRYHSQHPAGAPDCREGSRLLLEALARSSAEERRRGTTLVGPHRDDMEFLLNGMPLKRHASQGQQRSFVLALKMAEIRHLENSFDNPPILLLDDMTSELDRERNLNLMEFLGTRRMQVFLTTTAPQNVMLHGADDHRTFRIEAGRVHFENRGNDE
jgi:DNA replication and repair protein RecF